ncbi:zinc finger (c3hc4 ring finger) protein [Cyclospora cayetanensis]|uniref:Zinc finger (C3hc4 ring finger) protein n=1 Tax=Cyclospora cayetanensis TaxID=88456 RepID=A0A1D3D890_9EIME|nr:zinc finger (c3hc4 ring finger) protein [Cyclospora cayetanensis]
MDAFALLRQLLCVLDHSERRQLRQQITSAAALAGQEEFGFGAAFCWQAAVAFLSDSDSADVGDNVLREAIHAAATTEENTVKDGLLLVLMCGLTVAATEGRGSQSISSGGGRMSLVSNTRKALSRAAGTPTTAAGSCKPSSLLQQVHEALVYMVSEQKRRQALLLPLLKLLLKAANEEQQGLTKEHAALTPLRVIALALCVAAATDAGAVFAASFALAAADGCRGGSRSVSEDAAFLRQQACAFTSAAEHVAAGVGGADGGAELLQRHQAAARTQPEVLQELACTDAAGEEREERLQQQTLCPAVRRYSTCLLSSVALALESSLRVSENAEAILAAPLLGLRCSALQQPLMKALHTFPWGMRTICSTVSSSGLLPAAAGVAAGAGDFGSPALADASLPLHVLLRRGLQASRDAAEREADAAAAAVAANGSVQEQSTASSAEAQRSLLDRFMRAVEEEGDTEQEETEEAAEAEEQRHLLQLQLRLQSHATSEGEGATEKGLLAAAAPTPRVAPAEAGDVDNAEASVELGRAVLQSLLQPLFGSSFAVLLLETHDVAARLLALHLPAECSSGGGGSASEVAVQRDAALCLRGWVLALEAASQAAAPALQPHDAEDTPQAFELTLLQAVLAVRPAAAADAAAAIELPQVAAAADRNASMAQSCLDETAACGGFAPCGCKGCLLLSNLRSLSLGEALVQMLFHILTYYEEAAAAARAAAMAQQKGQSESSAGSMSDAVSYVSPWLCGGLKATPVSSLRLPSRCGISELPHASAACGEEGCGLLQQFPVLQSGWEDLGEPFLWLLASRVYALLLLAAPHCIRKVWSHCADAGARQQLESFTERFITPWFMEEESRRCSLLVGSGCVRLVNFEPRMRRIMATCREEAADFSVKVAVHFPRGFPLQRAKLVLPEETVPGVPRGRLGWWTLAASALMERTCAARGLALWSANLSLFFEVMTVCLGERAGPLPGVMRAQTEDLQSR